MDLRKIYFVFLTIYIVILLSISGYSFDYDESYLKRIFIYDLFTGVFLLVFNYSTLVEKPKICDRLVVIIIWITQFIKCIYIMVSYNNGNLEIYLSLNLVYFVLSMIYYYINYRYYKAPEQYTVVV